ncbi:hypothetical protein BT69DRAFT_1279443 [Atractiella rhizophila]|nr:hypothetical protein BT69DRAFT_1279443 [Atractiella rhizophila]
MKSKLVVKSQSTRLSPPIKSALKPSGSKAEQENEGKVIGKRKRDADEEEGSEVEDGESASESGGSASGSESESESEVEGGEGEGQSEGDDEAAIASMQDAKKKKKKPKARALSPTSFGASLTHLLSLPAPPSHVPHTAPSHLLPRAKGSPKPSKLEKEARSLVRQEKRELAERGWVSDVIGGWAGEVEWSGRPIEFREAEEGEGGAEREKRLRRLAQKGVVRLFNAVRAAQGVKDEEVEELPRRKRRKVEEEQENDIDSAIVKEEVGEEKAVGAERKGLNIMGTKGKAEALSNLSKASFLQLLRQGGKK